MCSFEVFDLKTLRLQNYKGYREDGREMNTISFPVVFGHGS